MMMTVVVWGKPRRSTKGSIEKQVNVSSMKYLARDHMSLVEQIDELIVTAALSSLALLVLACVPSVDAVLRLVFGRFLLLFSDHHRQ